MKADFRISQRSNISNRLAANSMMKMSRAHEKIEKMRLMSLDNMQLHAGFSSRTPGHSHFAKNYENYAQTEESSRMRGASHDFGGNLMQKKYLKLISEYNNDE